ncbi:LysM domain-containing protein [Rhodococcus aetherivorans]|uniref:LysM domain-containing protein n=1 Tax=Rhodococcus aetherivorans TaxID=191292 RepID=UPI00366B7C6B
MSTAPFPPSSRYAGVEVATFVGADGRPIAYLRRRILPQPERLGLLATHVVTDGDRLDRIAATYLGDPQQFWRVADANRAMCPGELTGVVGRRLRITLPDGIGGVSRD